MMIKLDLQIDKLYQGYLNHVYQKSNGNHVFEANQSKALREQGICLTYGELLYPSVKKLIRKMALNSQDRFLDLGSGLAKCAMQIFLQTDVGQVLGIEASSFLHQQAYQIAKQVQEDFPCFWENRSFTLLCDNFLQIDWQNPTVVYSCSTCFTTELLVAIGEKINQTPSIQQVFSLRALPTIHLPLKAVFGIECSWDSALCFHYVNPVTSR